MDLKNNSVAVVDSGIGGISVLMQLIKKFGGGNYIYFADNLYMPYGNKSKTFIAKRMENIIGLLQTKYNVEKVVIACNTASTCIDVSKYNNIHTMNFNKNLTFLATSLTKKNLVGYKVLGDKTLAKQIEKYIFNEKKLKQCVKRHIKQHNLWKYTEMVLGCTHYELVAKYFKQYSPKTTFVSNSEAAIANINIPQTTELNIVLLMSKPSEKFYNKFKHTISFLW